jgi:predicted N-acetyltransferase YhbS
MDFRTCASSDIASAVALSRRVFKDNMAEQFIRLFGEENKDRMFVAVDDENVVRSLLCYYPSTVWADGAAFRIGAIGSVCTDAAFRGKGLASRLLQNAYAKMAEEAIPVSVISGGGGIYEASGATLTGAMIECRIDATKLHPAEGISIRPVDSADFPVMRAMNQFEPVRFDRTLEEFADLFRGQTYPDTFATYPAWMIDKANVPVAYAIGILENGKDELGLKEYAGDRGALHDAFAALLNATGKQSVHFAAVPGDPILADPDLVTIATTQHASLRLNDPKAFIRAIAPLLEVQGLSELRVESRDAGWVFQDRNRSVRFADLHELNRFVFGVWKPSRKRGSITFQNDLAKVFPVKFPWTHNLNYQ